MSIVTQPYEECSDLPVFSTRFTVEEYHQMGEAGVLTEEDQVELLEGWIVTKMNRKPIHDSTVATEHDLLRKYLPDGWHVRGQMAVTTGDSEPEPDLAIVRGKTRDYVSAHPRPQDVALVIEVAESSLGRDRAKRRLYARAGIPQYWIINLTEAVVEVYTQPSHAEGVPAYGEQQNYSGDELVPFVIEEREIARIPARELLP
ncbi:MAG: Uma2 family endonuclease [Planctomycetota bacterium]|nr:Uma2 family endonuclease [Planctomycetota bacterium]